MAVIAMAMAATMNTKSWTYEFGDWRITCWNSVVDGLPACYLPRLSRQALDQQAATATKQQQHS
jgi:magnesium-transporting ATPase (P-type)